MRVLVTGGSGFIGSHVVNRLLDCGDEPVIFDRHIRAPQPGTEVLLGDVRDATAVTEAVAHVDGVIHLAGVLGTQETIANPRPATETNVLGGLNVFEAIAQYQVPAVYIAVGNHWMNNTYSISKTCTERFAAMFNAERGTRIATVRALNAYGPGQVPARPYGPSTVRKITPAFACRALSGEPIEIYGDGSQVMDMVHVEDVAKILARALRIGPRPDGAAYEAGTGRRTTVLDIARSVYAAVGEHRDKITYLPMRPGEPPQSVVLGNPATLTPLYGEQPKLIDLEEGMAETVAWYRTTKGKTWGC